ncbi:metal-dependent transcriptional regulator [bacterium]|nr:metal-dependent transcriptional regulator [bacterium]
MPAKTPLSQSLEDYLETIFHLIQEGQVARVKDVAARLNVQMPSVTGAVRSLVARALVDHDPYSYITLTAKGEAIARDMVRRHEVLTHFLVAFLGLEEAVAERNACTMEHAIEPVVLDRLVGFIEHAESCPQASVQQCVKDLTKLRGVERA